MHADQGGTVCEFSERAVHMCVLRLHNQTCIGENQCIYGHIQLKSVSPG
jgi:hypothetical protein